MTIHKNIKNEPLHHPNDEYLAAINHRMDQLTALISEGGMDDETAEKLQLRLEQAIKNAANAGNERIKDEFSILLSSPQNTGRLIRLYLQGESIANFVLIVLSLIMIILGLGMIIMPAPPFFEMFTIFYFNRDDGITVMDLISLIIILAGVYFLIKGIYKNPSLKIHRKAIARQN